MRPGRLSRQLLIIEVSVSGQLMNSHVLDDEQRDEIGTSLRQG